MQYIEDFIKALKKKQANGVISYVTAVENIEIKNKVEQIDIPKYYLKMFSFFNGLIINQPRVFELLKFNDIEILENRFLHFANLNKKEKICFDLKKRNAAGEYNIVCHNNYYEITKTLSSFLTNKVWAWIERGREIWKDEVYKD